jgi:flagellar protein FliS
MTMAINAASAYNDSKVMTASPAELTLMLYEGAIKFCNIAIMAIEKNDIQKSNLNIIKAENIIMELRSTLDMKYPVSEQLDSIYDYIYRCLVEANIKKDKDQVENALSLIRELRDTWKEAMKLANSPKVAI